MISTILSVYLSFSQSLSLFLSLFLLSLSLSLSLSSNFSLLLPPSCSPPPAPSLLPVCLPKLKLALKEKFTCHQILGKAKKFTLTAAIFVVDAISSFAPINHTLFCDLCSYVVHIYWRISKRKWWTENLYIDKGKNALNSIIKFVGNPSCTLFPRDRKKMQM